MSTYISSTFNTSNTYVKFRLVVDVLSQDIINNRSQIRRRLQAWRTNTGFTTYGTGTSYMRTDYGAATTQGITSGQTITYNSYTVLYDDTVWISHNSDGSRVVYIGGYFVINSVVSSSMSDFGVTLPSIPRESTATATNADIESATSININKYLSSYTTTLRYEFPSGEVGALTGTIVTKTPNTSVGWTVPDTFYAKIPNNVSGVCKIYCDTYNGDTLIGTTSTIFTATVGVANKPDVSATIIDDVATALTGNNQHFVKFISSAVFNITSTPKNSATIVSRSIVCGAKSSTSASGTLTEVESAIFVVTTTDSRGLSNSVTYNRTLVNYVKLTNNPVITRTTPTGDTISYSITGNYFNGSFGSASNTLNLDYRVSEDNGSTWLDGGWQALTSISISGNTYSKSGVLSRTGGYDYTKQALVQIRAYDKIYTVSNPVSKSIPLAKGIPIFNYGADFFRVNTDMYLGSSKIIDSGSNANGEWVRYADGTMICTHAIVTSGACSLIDNFRFSSEITWTYPVAFISKPKPMAVSEKNTAYAGNVISCTPTGTSMVNTTSFKFYIMLTNLATTHDNTTYLTAIGKWK